MILISQLLLEEVLVMLPLPLILLPLYRVEQIRLQVFTPLPSNWNGTTVISYRGTNFDFAGGISPGAKDILNGWSLFAGIGANLQAAPAPNFYADDLQVDCARSSQVLPPRVMIADGEELGHDGD